MAHRKESGEKVSNISSELSISRSHLYILEEKYKNDPEMRDKRRDGRHDERIVRRVIQACKSKPFGRSVLLTREINQNLDEQKQISNTTFK